MDFDGAISRAETLAKDHPGASELLHFYRAAVRFQKEIYHRAKSAAHTDRQKLDTAMLASFFPDFLQLVEKYGPPELAGRAQKLEDRPDWESLLLACWNQTHDRLELLARAILQPYVQYLAERWHVEVGLLGDGTGSCPFCSRAPLVSVMNGKRMLVCSLCSYEWAFPEKRCPGCHAEKIDIHRHRAFGNLRVEACESCGHYLKAVDLRRDPQAVPVVDELAAVELDKLAREKGFTKFEVNLAGQ